MVVDVSMTSLGAVVIPWAAKNELSATHPTMYELHRLKEGETRYSEREPLAERWVARKRKYLVGATQFYIITDHPTLTYIFHKLCGELPPRVAKLCHGRARVWVWSCLPPWENIHRCLHVVLSHRLRGSSRVREVEAEGVVGDYGVTT